jgi:hypothetical protein
MKTIHDDRYLALIRRLVAEREQRSITQTVLASALVRPQSYVAKVENLERRLDIVELADWLFARQFPNALPCCLHSVCSRVYLTPVRPVRHHCFILCNREERLSLDHLVISSQPNLNAQTPASPVSP